MGDRLTCLPDGNYPQPVTRLATFAIVMLLAAGMTSCGDDGPSASDQRKADAAASASASAKASEAAASKSAEAQASRDAEDAADSAERQQTHDQCKTFLAGFVDALQQVDSRVTVGITFQDYTARIGDTRVAYDALGDADDIAEPCLPAGAALEMSFRWFAKANDKWNDCFTDIYCSTEEGSPTLMEMQADWVKASDKLEKGKQLIEDLLLESAPGTTNG